REVAVRGRDDANVEGRGAGGADGAHFPRLGHAQQLHLQRKWHVADLIEEERALVRGDEESPLVGDRARERSLHVTEELALEQRLRDRAAVDRDEGLVRAHTRAVDRTREQFLARAALALDQHARIAGGHALRLRQEIFHQRRARDDVLAPHLARGGGLRGAAAVQRERALDLREQLL